MLRIQARSRAARFAGSGRGGVRSMDVVGSFAGIAAGAALGFALARYLLPPRKKAILTYLRGLLEQLPAEVIIRTRGEGRIVFAADHVDPLVARVECSETQGDRPRISLRSIRATVRHPYLIPASRPEWSPAATAGARAG